MKTLPVFCGSALAFPVWKRFFALASRFNKLSLVAAIFCGVAGAVSAAVPVINSALTDSGTFNTAYSYTITQTGGTAPVTFAATGLPAGLTLAPATGVISGTPTAGGVFSVGLSATDNVALTGTATLALTIATFPATISEQPSGQTVTAGTDVTLKVTATATFGIAYQWYLNGVAITDATSATLLLSGARGSQSGSYTVVLTSGGTTVTSAAATVTVSGVFFTGSYFGTVGGTSGGTFGLSIRADNSAEMLIFLPGTPATTYVVPLVVDGDGFFAGIAGQYPSGTSAPVVNGRIVAGVLTGSTNTLGLALAGNLAAGSAPVDSFTASTIGASPTSFYLLSGANGTIMVLGANGTAPDYGTGTVQASGTFTVTGSSGAVYSGTIASGQVTGTVVKGTVTSSFSGVTDSVAGTKQLVNIASRSLAGTNDNATIAGFVLKGTGTRSLLVRAAGPALTGLGVTGNLTQPVLTLYQGSTVLAKNQGWGTATNSTDIAAAAATSGAFPFATGSADSAILMNLGEGSYTAIVNGANNGTGITLAEVYTVGGTSPRLANISTRGFVGPGDGVLIAGLVISGNSPKTMLMRGVGPTLASLGLAGSLADPQLQVYQGSTLIVSNDNWTNDAALVAATQSVGAFALPVGSKDAALLVALKPGAYTVIISGVNGVSGIGLVEIYEVQ